MCLNPIWITNPKKIISQEGGIKFKIKVECGACCECIEKKKQEANMRTYYECLDTFRQGGYILFDTLTYNNKNLPHISEFTNEIEKGSKNDFSCYRTDDIRKFTIRLRRYAKYEKLDIKNNLKYFIASEYGDNKQYIDDKGRLRKGTERPHYHILLFITNPKINKYQLSYLIKKAWGMGRCDGIEKGKVNVDKNTFDNDNENIKRVCNYVSKYVGKDMFYNKMIEKRLKKLNIEIDKDILKKQMNNFYRWSLKFGIYGIEYNSYELLYKGKMRIPDEKKIWKEMPLSKYLERKIYYSNINGKWKLNEIGKMRKLDHIEKNIKETQKRIEDIICNLKYYTDNTITRKFWKDEINFLLDGRNIRELAEYIAIYKGRLISTQSKMYNIKDDIKDLILNELLDEEEIIKSGKYFFNYSHSKYRKILGNNYISITDLDDIIEKIEKEKIKFIELILKTKENFKKGIIDFDKINNIEIIDKNSFEKLMTINQNYSWEFRSFDQLIKLLNEIVKDKNKEKQQTYETQLKLKKKLKK